MNRPHSPAARTVPSQTREALVSRVQAATQAVAGAAERSGRDPADISIVAVSKTFSVDSVLTVADAGICHFGENRIQEAEQKVHDTPSRLKWHMVGHLQRNKTKLAAELFDVIQSVDSLRLARSLDQASPKDISVFLQVNLSGNPEQHGLTPEKLLSVARVVDVETSLKLDGLMTIAPFINDQSTLRRSFATLSNLRKDMQDRIPCQPWTHLSMGMTNDFELAVEEGATIVRIGRAIFGDRR